MTASERNDFWLNELIAILGFSFCGVLAYGATYSLAVSQKLPQSTISMLPEVAAAIVLSLIIGFTVLNYFVRNIRFI